EIFSEGILWTVLLHTTFGHDWLARLVLAALLAAALGGISTKHVDLPRWAIAALLASAFAAALVHSGHAAATAGWLGTFHRAADGLHLIAASAWLVACCRSRCCWRRQGARRFPLRSRVTPHCDSQRSA